MGHLLRRLALVAVLLAAASPLLAFDGPTQGTDGAKKEPAKGAEAARGAAPPAAKDDKAAANTQRMLDAGVAAYEAGKEDQAIRAFDTLIRNGGLANRQMARALYYRGLANRKKGRAALAISDLTSAIWLKDGLSAAERQEAMSNRVAAYREAGVGDVPEIAAPAGVAASSSGSDGWQTAMSGSAPAPTAPAAPAASPAPPAQPASAPQTAAYTPARPPPPPPPASSSSSGVGGFFSSITNMFGGGSSSSGSSSGSVATTASLAEPPAATPAAWSQTTQVATASPPPPPPPAPAPPAPAAAPPVPEPQPAPQASAPPPAPFATQTQVAAVAPPIVERPPPATAAPSGKFHVQVAAVRSRDEAYALAVRLVAQHGGELGPRRPLVDQTVIGSMGTFYRVRVGPFASAQDSEPLCGSLRSSGFDCLIITQ